jgi:hypothetical protein
MVGIVVSDASTVHVGVGVRVGSAELNVAAIPSALVSLGCVGVGKRVGVAVGGTGVSVASGVSTAGGTSVGNAADATLRDSLLSVACGPPTPIGDSFAAANIELSPS